jgi:hypothetical protein
MLKTLIIAILLLPRLTIAQQSYQLPQPGGWMASDSQGLAQAGYVKYRRLCFFPL